MGILSKLLKTGLVLGGVYTAWQASETTRKQTGSYDQETFVRNFKDQAIENSKLVVDVVKSWITGKSGKSAKREKAAATRKPADTGYCVSDQGENGYAYKDAPRESTPVGDKVDEVFETIKEKAPEVIDKVHDFVDDVRENAPEYKAKAQEFVEDVKEAARKAMDTGSADAAADGDTDTRADTDKKE